MDSLFQGDVFPNPRRQTDRVRLIKPGRDQQYEEQSTMPTKAQKSAFKYTDFYCYMSLADFNVYISTDDEGDDSFPITSDE